ncbi:hypothetical protein LU290_09535 [Moraxella nasibovis]|uniref:PIN domain-containing protein n=1 Tax=Moraxella nasibovis TaxID=2904120 RepID=UPI00240FE8E4|nr:PIN domain-containing protein [Moraxella nasibovis]WFF38477.1 hypothetical protein LU290_09535 [Moraxella nasibovis]
MILVDSNVIIYYFNGVQKAEAFLTDNIGNMTISTLTVSEVLSKPNSSEQEIENIDLF